MRKRLLILIFFTSITNPIFSQKSIAALHVALRAAPNDSIRCTVLFQLVAFHMNTNVDSLEIFGKELIKTADRCGNAGFKISGLNALGLVAKRRGEFQQAVNLFFQALREAERIKNPRKEANVLLNLADAVNFYGQKNEAVAYLHRGFRLAERLPDSVLMVKFLNNLGYTYSKINSDSAFFYYQKAYELLRRVPDADFISLTIRANLAAQFSNQKKYEAAARLSREVLDEARRKGNDEHIFFGAQGLATNLNELHRPTEAMPFAREALAAAERFGNTENTMQATGTLAQSLQGVGDHENAFETLRKYIRLRDTLTNRLAVRNIADAETKYRTQVQAAELAEKKLLLERQQNRQNLLIFSALAMLAAAAGGFLFLKNRQRQRERETQLALQLEHAEAEKLRELDRMKSTFFANISHEFRTPLTLLLGPLREMRDGIFRGEPSQYFRMMTRNAERLLQLINQLLDLSKLESGKLKLQPTAGDLVGFLRAIVGSFESMAARRSIVFEMKFPDAPLAANFDKDVLEKILTNLLSNAFKFSHEEGSVIFEAQVTPTSRSANDTPPRPEGRGYLQISVRDAGIGIAEEQLPKIFDRFYQADALKTDDSMGSGIGLALTKELVELHGGQISVESRVGQGTVFTVVLPVEFLADDGRATADGSKTATSDLPPNVVEVLNLDDVEAMPPKSQLTLRPSSPKTVLVADDNPDVRAYIVQNLNQNFKILEAADGQQALEIAIAEMPELIVTDLMMPRMDGTALTKKLKTDPRTSHIPVIMLTAKAGQEEKIEGLETGADDYLTKPFDGRELQLRVRNLLEGRARMREKFAGEIRVQPKDVVVNSVDEQFLKKILETIEKRMADEQFGVEDLAAAAAMSRSQLHRKLTALTDLSPVEIIRKMRLERAHDLLRQGAGSVSEVAFEVGFSSQPYFSKCFADHFGYAPGEARRT